MQGGRVGCVEIAGGGIGGLVAGLAFARRGWKVRINERYRSLRIEGFGISVFENGLRVLESLGVYEAAVAEANWLRYRESRVEGANIRNRRTLKGHAYRISRRLITQALANAAADLGVELVFDSPAISADPAGALILEGGTRCEADLVIGADGLNSRVRESLGIKRKLVTFDEGAMRFIVRREPSDISDDEASTAVEWWSGSRRVIFSPCSKTEHYLALCCVESDVVGKHVPLDAESWGRSFPEIAYVFDRARKEVDWSRVQWANFASTYLSSWSEGRVALVGDAAHAMPPNLGQGGGCAMMSALGLAVAVTQATTIEEGLRLWERTDRPIIDHTQRLSVIYHHITRMPPLLQSATLWTINNIPPLRRQLAKTAAHWPTGAIDRDKARPLPTPNQSVLSVRQ